jgi:hypothetical protein
VCYVSVATVDDSVDECDEVAWFWAFLLWADTGTLNPQSDSVPVQFAGGSCARRFAYPSFWIRDGHGFQRLQLLPSRSRDYATVTASGGGAADRQRAAVGTAGFAVFFRINKDQQSLNGGDGPSQCDRAGLTVVAGGHQRSQQRMAIDARARGESQRVACLDIGVAVSPVTAWVCGQDRIRSRVFSGVDSTSSAVAGRPSRWERASTTPRLDLRLPS